MGARALSQDNMVGRGIDHPPPSRAEVRHEKSYASSPLLSSLCLHGLLLGEWYTLPCNSVAVSTVRLYRCAEYFAVTHRDVV